MKNIVIVFLLCVSTIYINSQTSVIDELYSPKIYICGPAASSIIVSELIDAYPHLVTLYDEKPPIIQSIFLDALYALGEEHSLLASRLHNYINRADDFINEEFPLDPLIEKVHATYLLILIGDYSTYNYVFDLIQRDGLSDLNSNAFNALIEILNKIPDGESQAKSNLLNIWVNNNSPTTDRSYLAMVVLVKKYGIEMSNSLISTFTNNNDHSKKLRALELLSELNYPGLNNLLISNLNVEHYATIRLRMTDTLLTKYGYPSSLKTIIDYQPTEPDETARSLMAYSINSFVPPRPTVTTAEMIDNLISYNNELFHYGWITDQRTYNQYAAILGKIQTAYRSHSQRDLCENLSALLSTVEKHHNTPLLTTEGYKFLYYHGKYIKENVEQEFGSCP